MVGSIDNLKSFWAHLNNYWEGSIVYWGGGGSRENNK